MLTTPQVLLGWPFISKYPREYISRAFEFSRVFQFKWTVNWRFVGEDVFLSRTFSLTLLIAQVSLLALFAIRWWLAPSKQTVPEIVRSIYRPPSPSQQAVIGSRITPQYCMTTILSSMAIGMLCARSLHYQFYSYIAWTTPYLLWQGGQGPVLLYMVWIVQEIAWNVYPSTVISSVVVVLSLLVAVLSSWFASASISKSEEAKKVEHVE